jgi:hypothetical protein
MKDTKDRKIPIEEKEQKYDPSKGPRKNERRQRHFPGEREKQSIEDPQENSENVEREEEEVMK